MSERKWYVRCETGCIAESMTKEQILTAISQAMTTGEIGDVDTGFITRIKEQNNGAGLSFWVGTQAEYNALDPKLNNCFYIITDDTTADDINKAVADMQKTVEECERLSAEAKGAVDKMNVVLWEGKVEVVDEMEAINCECNGIHNYKLLLLVIKDKTNLTSYTILAYNNAGSVEGSAFDRHAEWTASISVFDNGFTVNWVNYKQRSESEYETAYLTKVIGIM